MGNLKCMHSVKSLTLDSGIFGIEVIQVLWQQGPYIEMVIY